MNASKNVLLLALLAAVIIGVIYFPVFNADFNWDDGLHVYDNPVIKSGGLYRAWFSSEQTNYWPVTWTAFWAQWNIWGNNAHWFHVVNIVFHIAVVLLIWGLLARLRAPGAWLAAMIFAAHPVNVETVAWISQLKNILAMMFALFAILFYLRFEGRGKTANYVLALTAFLLAALSKPSVAMAPVVLLGFAWWRRGRVGNSDIVRALPFFFISLLSGLAEIYFQYEMPATRLASADSFLPRIIGAGWIFWFYLGKAIIPFHLAFFYPKWHFNASETMQYVPALLLLVAGVIILASRKRGLILGFGLYLAMLSPVMGFLSVAFFRFSYVTDHYQYVAIIAIISLAVVSGARLMERHNRALRRVIKISAALIIVGLSLMSWNQAKIYKNERDIWNDTIAKNPDCMPAYYNLGVYMRGKGDWQRALALYDRAVDAWMRNPDATLKAEAAGALTNRGEAKTRMRDVQGAIDDYSCAIDINGGFAPAYGGRGNLYIRLREYDKALDDLQAAARIGDNPWVYAYMGAAYEGKGEDDKALECYNRAVQMDARLFDALYNRAVFHFNRENFPQALCDFNKAIELNPGVAEGYYFRSQCYFNLGQIERAVEDMEAARRLGRAPSGRYEDLLMEASRRTSL